MPFSSLAIYTTAHGLDKVEAHLDKLESLDTEPDLIALESPDVPDTNHDIKSAIAELIKRSPATVVPVYLVARKNKQAYQDSDNTAARADSEFEAGRQYAEHHSIPHVSVDLPWAKIAARYATWPRRIRDATTLLVGVLLALSCVILAIQSILIGFTLLNNHGVSNQGITGVALGIGGAVMLFLVGVIVLLYTIGKIGRWFLDTVRTMRDKAMYKKIKAACDEYSARRPLLIVGAAHYSGIKSIADLMDAKRDTKGRNARLAETHPDLATLLRNRFGAVPAYRSLFELLLRHPDSTITLHQLSLIHIRLCC
jgi:hypothetical protein